MTDTHPKREELLAEIEELRAEVAALTKARNSSDSERSAQLQAVWDAAIDGIIVISEMGSIESINPSTERMFGYTGRELIGKNVNILMPPPYHDAHDGYLASYRRTGEKKIIGVGREVSGLRKDGSEFPMELAVAEVVTDERRTFAGFVRDITERKAMEARAAQQQQDIRELSTPCIRIWDGVVTAPVIGVLDSSRGQQLMESLLEAIVESKSKVAILDITGVVAVDTYTAAQLLKTIQAVELLGCRAIVTGIRKEIAQTLVGLGEVGLSSVETKATMMDGFASAFEFLGLMVERRPTAPTMRRGAGEI